MGRRTVGVLAAIVASLVLMVGCGSGVSPTEQSQQQSIADAEASLRDRGFTRVTLRIRRADGTIEVHCVWLADAEVERERGLMEITDPTIGGGDAMVFSFPTETSASFWMKDTPMPLSIAWIGADGVVLSTADMAPCPADQPKCPSYPPSGPYRLAIEMAQGRLADWAIEPGSTVTLADAC